MIIQLNSLIRSMQIKPKPPSRVLHVWNVSCKTIQSYWTTVTMLDTQVLIKDFASQLSKMILKQLLPSIKKGFLPNQQDHAKLNSIILIESCFVFVELIFNMPKNTNLVASVFLSIQWSQFHPNLPYASQ